MAPEPDAWHVHTFQHQDQQFDQQGSVGPEDTDGDDDLATPETAPVPAAADYVDALAMWRRKREERQSESLADLAQQWADGPVADKDNWLERTLAARPQSQIAPATDPTGQPVTAIPATRPTTGIHRAPTAPWMHPYP